MLNIELIIDKNYLLLNVPFAAVAQYYCALLLLSCDVGFL